ncbi:MAG TPA: DUF4118 domain-containing protein [Acidobacteriaceae bacterium]|nr:DUF4118 domain-containing protein [Acidobacteriaceae bacterium]
MHRLAVWRRALATCQWDSRVPASIAAGIAFTATLVSATALAAAHAAAPVALGVMVVIVTLSGWLVTWSGAVVTAALAWLMLNGFVTDRYGVLRWHGHRDLVELAVLFASATTVATVRATRIRRSRRRAMDHLTQQLSELTDAAHRTLGGRHA